jgi:hypothetical protein
MANTFELIASSTVGSGGAATVTFSSIPSTYTDLCLKVSARTLRTDVVYDPLGITFNSSSSGYSTRMVYGLSGTAASATSGSTSAIDWAYAATSLATSNTFSSIDIYVPNYASSNNKSVSIDSVTENNGTAAIANLNAGLWSNSAAITSIVITTPNGLNLVEYSSFYLYGVKNA